MTELERAQAKVSSLAKMVDEARAKSTLAFQHYETMKSIYNRQMEAYCAAWDELRALRTNR